MAAKVTMEDRLDGDLLEGGHYDLGYLEGRALAKGLTETIRVQLETSGAAAILIAAKGQAGFDAIVQDLANNVVQSLL